MVRSINYTDLEVEGEERGGVESSELQTLASRSGVEEDCLPGARLPGKLNWLSWCSGAATGAVWTLIYREGGLYIACCVQTA